MSSSWTWGGSLSLDDLTSKYRIRAPNGAVPSQLFHACWKEDAKEVANLLKAGVDVNSKDSHQDTPLHAACSRGSVEVVKLLLEAGAVCNVRNKLKVTPLHRAASLGRTEVVKALLEHGAVVAPRDDFDGTPLHAACTRGHAPAAAALLEAGAPLESKNRAGNTPLLAALGEGAEEAAALLVEKGARRTVANNKGQTPECLVRTRANLDSACKARLTAILRRSSGEILSRMWAAAEDLPPKRLTRARSVPGPKKTPVHPPSWGEAAGPTQRLAVAVAEPPALGGLPPPPGAVVVIWPDKAGPGTAKRGGVCVRHAPVAGAAATALETGAAMS